MIDSYDKQQVKVHSLGLVPYEEALVYQESLRDELVSRKRESPSLSAGEGPLHHVIFCQHHPVYTMGKSGKSEHLLVSEKELAEKGVSFHKAGRGGDITFHGPGQLVCYPIFDLDWFFTDVHQYVRFLEESVIRLCADLELSAFAMKSFTGVWLGSESSYRKICAIGVHLSRWVTMHGLALNVNTDLSFFNHVVPCGIDDANKSVTSLAQELGHSLSLDQVEESLAHHLAEIFDFQVLRH